MRSLPPETDDGRAHAVWATAVAWCNRAALIVGPSGAGKSTLALQIMAMGGQLIADDRILVFRLREHVFARRPSQSPDLIEARGVGLLRAVSRRSAPIGLVVDLAQHSDARLPPPLTRTLLGVPVATVHNSAQTHMPSAILQHLGNGHVA